MAHSRRVSPRFWTRGSGRALRGDPEGQLLALYLVTGPSADWTGLYRLSLGTAAHDLGMNELDADHAMERVVAAGLAKYDPDHILVWVPNAAEVEFGAKIKRSDKRAAAIDSHLDDIGPHPFAEEFRARYFDQEAPSKKPKPRREAPSVSANQEPGSPFPVEERPPEMPLDPRTTARTTTTSRASPAGEGLHARGDGSFWPMVRGYTARYEAATGTPWMSLDANRRAAEQIAAWLDASGTDVDVWLDAWFSTRWDIDNRWPWSHAAKNPDQFLAPTPKAQATDADTRADRKDALRRTRERVDEAQRALSRGDVDPSDDPEAYAKLEERLEAAEAAHRENAGGRS